MLNEKTTGGIVKNNQLNKPSPDRISLNLPCIYSMLPPLPLIAFSYIIIGCETS